jgi:MoxR-like ATPase
LSVLAVAKAVAQLRGRTYVLPRDVQEVFLPAVSHRLILGPGAKNQGETPQKILTDTLKSVPAPKLK